MCSLYQRLTNLWLHHVVYLRANRKHVLQLHLLLQLRKSLALPVGQAPMLAACTAHTPNGLKTAARSHKEHPPIELRCKLPELRQVGVAAPGAAAAHAEHVRVGVI